MRSEYEQRPRFTFYERSISNSSTDSTNSTKSNNSNNNSINNRVRFCEKLNVTETFAPCIYNRAGPIYTDEQDPFMDLIAIADELDLYKIYEMEIHPDSVANTLLYSHTIA